MRAVKHGGLSPDKKENTVTDLYREEIIDPGDRASRLARDICFASHGNCPAVTVIPHQPENFRGPVGFSWSPQVLLEMSRNWPSRRSDWSVMEEVENDGAGGKPQFFTLLNDPATFRDLGWEIITMTADDFARSGRFPAVIVNEMNVKAITDQNFHLFQACMEGYGEALRKANLVNITGEVAIMKHSITAFCDGLEADQLVLTWGATCIGLARKEFLIDGSAIRPGMPIVGFSEQGYRCNGGTFFTNLLMRKYRHRNGCPNFHLHDEAKAFVKALTIPSISYAKTICRLVGWKDDGHLGQPLANITGIAHITGGGVWGKFGEILPKGVAATLDSMPLPPEVLLQAQEMSRSFDDLRMSDYQAYETFHGGCGMLVVCADERHANVVISEAAKDGVTAQTVGWTHELTENGNQLIIVSRFRNRGEILRLKA